MASLQLAVEDCSPLISYAPAGAWVDTPANDSLTSSYSGSSLHTTSELGASATIRFNGTGISVFGGNRLTYGSYDFSVDGETIMSGNAQSPTPSFNQTLGTVSGLPNGPHIAVLTNTAPSSSLDIDWFQFDTGTAATDTTVDDSSPLVSYEPSSDWQTNNRGIFMGNTTHYTSVAGASASLNFSGDAVAIYGTVSPDHADIQVTLDNEVVTFTGGSGGFVQQLHPKTLLYFRSNLGSQQHNLVVSADPHQGTGPFLDIDSFSVYTMSAGTPNTTTASSLLNTLPSISSVSSASSVLAIPSVLAAPSVLNTLSVTDTPSVTISPSATRTDSISTTHSKSDQKNILSKTVLIGTACAAAITVMILVLALAFFMFRRIKRSRSAAPIPRTPITPALPIQNPGMEETRFEFSSTLARRFKATSHSYTPSQDSGFSLASNGSEEVLVSNTPTALIARGADSTVNVNHPRQPKYPALRPPALQLTVV